MATYTIRQNKLDIIIAAHKNGSEINEDTVAEILSIKTPKAIKAYVKAFNEINDQEETSEEPKQEAPPVKEKKKKTFSASKMKTPKEYTYFVEDENGAEIEHEVIAVTENSIILKKVEPIIKHVFIGGVEIEVDLRKLRKEDPDAQLHGVKVSSLLTAAELA